MHILFAFLTAAVVMTGALTSLSDRNDEQEAQLASWSFFLNRLENKLTTKTDVAGAPVVEKEPVIVPNSDTFTMAWEIPSARLDGSNLSTGDLSGYELYYTDPNQGINETVFVDDPSQTAYEFQDFEPGKYMLAIAAVDVNGIRSPSSSLIEVVVE